MPLYKITNKKISVVRAKQFSSEKELQNFVESNLNALFGVRFLKSEWVVPGEQSGRIDTIGIDQNDTPTIIEYKHSSSSSIINQSLFYSAWIQEHPDAFRFLASKKTEKDLENLKTPRIILIADSFSKFDRYAITVLQKNIDLQLWRYKLYENDTFELIQVNSNPDKKKSPKIQLKKSLKINYDIDFHRNALTSDYKIIFDEIRDYILDLDEKITESCGKSYVAFRTNKNFVEFITQKKNILIFLDTPLKTFKDHKELLCDSANNKRATGNSLLTVTTKTSLTAVFDLIKQSYEFNS